MVPCVPLPHICEIPLKLKVPFSVMRTADGQSLQQGAAGGQLGKEAVQAVLGQRGYPSSEDLELMMMPSFSARLED